MNDPSRTHRQFWWAYLRYPLLAFVVLAGICDLTSLDIFIAQTWFYDSASQRWVGVDNWWINGVLRSGGRWTIRIIVLLSLMTWAATFFVEKLRHWRRVSSYIGLGMIASVATVGLLKTLTNVDCPWDLTLFGGKYPWVPLFADRPDDLRRAGCFPAAHASSGYALMALYFALRDRRSTLARWGLALGIAAGVAFGIAQQSRGAHFLSHDIWSVFLVWSVLLSVYVFGFKRQLYADEVRTLPHDPGTTALGANPAAQASGQ